MTPERWHQIEHIFNAAFELRPDEREAYLKEACENDRQLFREVESLIASYEAPTYYLEESAFDLGLQIIGNEQEAFPVSGTVGKYKLLSVLGTGGMGEVFLAQDPRLGRKVALKLLPASLVDDASCVLRFQQEARAASNISHPNIAHIYEAGEADGHHYIAMEYVEGHTLRDEMARGPVKADEALGIAIQIASALKAAHAAGIIHRDIKPENIMLRRDGFVKVLDFGLAKATENWTQLFSDTEMSTIARLDTTPGSILGTVLYMSPEQLRVQGVDARTDIWSLGVVLYEMVAGHTPFDWMTKSDTIASILDREPPPLASYVPAAPAALQNIINRALTKGKEQRYQTVEELLADLQRLKRELDLQSSLEHRADNVVDEGAAPAPGSYPQQSTEIIEKPPPTGEISQARWTSGVELLFEGVKNHQKGVFALAAATVLLGAFLYLLPRQRPVADAGQQLELIRVPITNNIKEAAISPDGKYVATIVDEAGGQSIVVKQMHTSNYQQVVAPTGERYKGLSFSPDGDYIYYQTQAGETGVLYRVPAHGGTTRRLTSNVDSPVTLSPDSGRLAFIRLEGEGKESSLIIANSDGSDEERLATLKEPQMFKLHGFYSSGPAWSPDGMVIACPAVNVEGGSPNNLVVVNVGDGSVRQLNSQGWAVIEKVVWLADGSGLVMNANDRQPSPFQLWLLSYPGGEARRITNDPNSYVALSATRDGQTLLTMKLNYSSTVWVVSPKEAHRATQIASSKYKGASGISWTARGEIVYSSSETGSSNIWMMQADGSGRKQLTFGDQPDIEPVASPDGRYIVFVGYRGGLPYLWRVGTDGTDLKRLTNGGQEDTPQITPDGQWVIYHSNEQRSALWKVSINGGNPVRLTNVLSTQPSISSDGRLITCFMKGEETDSPWRIAIIPVGGGEPTRTFDIPGTVNPMTPGLSWYANNSSVTYVSTVGGVSNIWSQPVSGGAPERLTDFVEGQIISFAWSPDAAQLACVRGGITQDLFLVRGFK